MNTRVTREALEFAPGLLAIQESPPAPLPRAVMYTVLVLTALLLVWAVVGRLDIVASAEGRLIPRTYIKIVQPADAGIVQEILVREGETVRAGQVLLRMDRKEAQSDSESLATELALKSLQMRRAAAELDAKALRALPADPADLFQQVQAQFLEHRRAYDNNIGQSREALRRAEEEYQSGLSTLEKLRKLNPSLQEQAQSYEDLGKDGYAAQVLVAEKQRLYLENDQDLHSQQSKVASLQAEVAEARDQVLQITSKYRSDLQNERVQAEGEYRKLQQDSIKQAHKAELLELRAPQAGIVKDLSTHTAGTVVSAGTVILSIVPEQEPLVAEINIRNEDVGFVHADQPVQVKLAAYPFQKYGMLHGQVIQVWPDSTDGDARGQSHENSGSNLQAEEGHARGYRAWVHLDAQSLERGGADFKLIAGMQVVAEIDEGRRTLLEYLLSPVQKTLQESARER
jgi:hemolysin D